MILASQPLIRCAQGIPDYDAELREDACRYFLHRFLRLDARRVQQLARLPRILGRCRANTIAPRIARTPPIATVQGAPIWSADQPESSAPNGAMPMNIIEYTAMVRPRSRSGTIA